TSTSVSDGRLASAGFISFAPVSLVVLTLQATHRDACSCLPRSPAPAPASRGRPSVAPAPVCTAATGPLCDARSALQIPAPSSATKSWAASTRSGQPALTQRPHRGQGAPRFLVGWDPQERQRLGPVVSCA